MTSNRTFFAAYLGFDGYEFNNNKEVVLLNRKKIVVSSSEYNRIIEAAKVTPPAPKPRKR